MGPKDTSPIDVFATTFALYAQYMPYIYNSAARDLEPSKWHKKK
jgi:hypothetical protein